MLLSGNVQDNKAKKLVINFDGLFALERASRASSTGKMTADVWLRGYPTLNKFAPSGFCNISTHLINLRGNRGDCKEKTKDLN